MIAFMVIVTNTTERKTMELNVSFEEALQNLMALHGKTAADLPKAEEPKRLVAFRDKSEHENLCRWIT